MIYTISKLVNWSTGDIDQVVKWCRSVTLVFVKCSVNIIALMRPTVIAFYIASNDKTWGEQALGSSTTYCILCTLFDTKKKTNLTEKRFKTRNTNFHGRWMLPRTATSIIFAPKTVEYMRVVSHMDSPQCDRNTINHYAIFNHTLQQHTQSALTHCHTWDDKQMLQNKQSTHKSRCCEAYVSLQMTKMMTMTQRYIRCHNVERVTSRVPKTDRTCSSHKCRLFVSNYTWYQEHQFSLYTYIVPL